MRPGSAILWPFAALLLPLPAAAQDNASSVRLDDFALPASDASLRVEQVPSREKSTVLTPLIERDRSDPTAGDQIAAAAEAEVQAQQLAPVGELAEPVQLGGDEARTAQAVQPLSSTSDSRPGRVQRLVGRDKCDPQVLTAEKRAECEAILELRAAEFNALRPPELSAEQKLLAAQQMPDRSLSRTPRNGAMGGAMSSGLPDAEDRSNQELASLVLDAPPPPAVPELPSQGEVDPAIGEIIEGVVGQVFLPPGT